MGRFSILHNGWACIYIRRRLYAFIFTVLRTRLRRYFLLYPRSTVEGFGTRAGRAMDQNLRWSFLSTASLANFLFYYMRAPSVQNAGSHSLLLNLDLMHPFGAQTATISHSSFAITFLTSLTWYGLKRSYSCNVLGFESRRAAARLESLRCALARRSCIETRHPCAHACHCLYLHALAATQSNVFAI